MALVFVSCVKGYQMIVLAELWGRDCSLIILCCTASVIALEKSFSEIIPPHPPSLHRISHTPETKGKIIFHIQKLPVLNTATRVHIHTEVLPFGKLSSVFLKLLEQTVWSHCHLRKLCKCLTQTLPTINHVLVLSSFRWSTVTTLHQQKFKCRHVNPVNIWHGWARKENSTICTSLKCSCLPCSTKNKTVAKIIHVGLIGLFSSLRNESIHVTKQLTSSSFFLF